MADDTIKTTDGVTLKSDADPEVRRIQRTIREMTAAIRKHWKKSKLDRMVFSSSAIANLALFHAESLRSIDPALQRNFAVELINALASQMDGGQLRDLLDAGRAPKH